MSIVSPSFFLNLALPHIWCRPKLLAGAHVIDSTAHCSADQASGRGRLATFCKERSMPKRFNCLRVFGWASLTKLEEEPLLSRPARAAKEAGNNEISEKVWTLGWRRARSRSS